MSENEKTSQFKLMEAADNAQIVAEINGEMLKEMVYTVKGKSRLSYAGAKFAAIKLGNIHVRESTVTYNKELDQFEASALAYNGNNNLTLPGHAEQNRLMQVWDNKEKTESHLEPDEFARRKAASKSVRNALMAVMPADHIAAYLKAMIGQGKARVIINKPKTVEAEVVVKPPEPSQVRVRSGPLTLSVIENEFRALTYSHEIREFDHYELWADTANVYIGPREGLEPELKEKITELLKEYAPTWQDQGQYGQWQIPKEQG